MTPGDELPDHVRTFLRSGSIAQYATVSAAGMPIDTPVLYFPSEDLRSFNLATGLSYPAKAERARRNPRVGLYLEGGPDEPVVSIAGMAAVRDADLQDNVNRYVAEACYTLPYDPPWELARQAVWYWTRIIVEITPVQMLWWDRPADMDGLPQRWEAPPGTSYRPSDPAPPGKVSAAAKWDMPAWRDLAGQALARGARGARGHVSVCTAAGFPLPAGLRQVELVEDGFLLDVPGGIAWPLSGPACLTFGGIETFLGRISGHGARHHLAVERTLPIFPMTQDMAQLWHPTPDTRAQLMRRLEEELLRRGQPVPTVPETRPPPSEGYRRRLLRMGKSIEGEKAPPKRG